MQLYLLRHGKTAGNLEHRYVGRTDEGILPQEVARLGAVGGGLALPKGAAVFSSPLRRCLETAKALCPGCAPRVLPGFREMDFGVFEYKNFQELDGDPVYQQWVDSGCTLPVPGGESMAALQARSLAAFADMVRLCANQSQEAAVAVVHGGTLMSVLSAFAEPQKPFYAWMTENGSGYLVCLDAAAFLAGDRRLQVLRKLP